MPKRKREDGIEDDAVAKPGSIKQQRVAYKLQQGVKRVAHAFKLAKGFERQKLSRRRKTATAQQKAQDVERIDAEIVSLKALDHAAAAQQHVYKSLLKIKAVAEHPDLPAEVQKPLAKFTDAPTLNVIARLCKSNQAKEALTPAIADVQNALGLDGGTVAKKRKRAKDHEQEKNEKDLGTAVKPGSVLKKATASATARNEVQDASEEDDFAEFDDRLASSEEDHGGAAIGDDDASDSDHSVGALERQLESEGISRNASKKRTTNGYNHEADLSLSESESNAPSLSPEPQKATAVTKSAFLPTLTLGGYISGSGSDIEDEIDAAPKKNRRGQRARQQIWEQKYGAKAKHLGKEKDGRKSGWDAKRGATDGSERFGKGRLNGGARGKLGSGRGAPSAVRMPVQGEAGGQKKKHRDDGGPIHPSWEAAKKAKERKEAPVAFQGKKITFD